MCVSEIKQCMNKETSTPPSSASLQKSYPTCQIWTLFLILEMDPSLPKIPALPDKIGGTAYATQTTSDLTTDSSSSQANSAKPASPFLNYCLSSVWLPFLHVLRISSSLPTTTSLRKSFISGFLGKKRPLKPFGEAPAQEASTMIQDTPSQFFTDSAWSNYAKKSHCAMHISFLGSHAERESKEPKFRRHWWQGTAKATRK